MAIHFHQIFKKKESIQISIKKGVANKNNIHQSRQQEKE
jgi:hypothetical protein